MEARLVSLPTPAATPATIVRLEGDRIVVDRLTLLDPGLAAYVAERPADDRPALAVISAIGGVAVAVVGLAALGAVGWIVIGRRRRLGRSLGAVPAFVSAYASEGDESALAPRGMPGSAWADAACPACLALAFVVGERR